MGASRLPPIALRPSMPEAGRFRERATELSFLVALREIRGIKFRHFDPAVRRIPGCGCPEAQISAPSDRSTHPFASRVTVTTPRHLHAQADGTRITRAARRCRVAVKVSGPGRSGARRRSRRELADRLWSIDERRHRPAGQACQASWAAKFGEWACCDRKPRRFADLAFRSIRQIELLDNQCVVPRERNQWILDYQDTSNDVFFSSAERLGEIQSVSGREVLLRGLNAGYFGDRGDRQPALIGSCHHRRGRMPANVFSRPFMPHRTSAIARCAARAIAHHVQSRTEFTALVPSHLPGCGPSNQTGKPSSLTAGAFRISPPGTSGEIVTRELKALRHCEVLSKRRGARC